MDESGTQLGYPIEISNEAITRLNEQGYRPLWPALELVDSAREALARMPYGKNGVVIGSGPNTQAWREKGWHTLDIDRASGADYVVDANDLETVIPANSQDFLFAEAIRMDEGGNAGVGWGRLLNQANYALKNGGELIIQTAHKEGVSHYYTPRSSLVC